MPKSKTGWRAAAKSMKVAREAYYGWSTESIKQRAYIYGVSSASLVDNQNLLQALIVEERKVERTIESTPLAMRKLFTRLYALPVEFRLHVYRHVVVDNNNIIYPLKTPALLQVSRQIRSEALPIFYTRNAFAIDMTNSRGLYMPATSRFPAYLEVADYSHSLWQRLARTHLTLLRHLGIHLEWMETSIKHTAIRIDVDLVAGGNSFDCKVQVCGGIKPRFVDRGNIQPIDNKIRPIHDRLSTTAVTKNLQSEAMVLKVKQSMEAFLLQVVGRGLSAKWVEADLVQMKSALRFALKAQT